MAVSAPASQPARQLGVPALVSTLVGLLLIFVGERILATFDALRWGATGLGALLVVAAIALRFRAAGSDPRLAKLERRQALLSIGAGLALVLYALSTKTGLRLLGLSPGSPELRARVDEGLTVAFVSLLAITVIPLILGELALRPMRSAPEPELRRVVMAQSSGASLGMAAVYASLLCYAVAALDISADFSFFRTAAPSDATHKIVADSPEPVRVLVFFPPNNEVATEVVGYFEDLARGSDKLTVERQDPLLAPELARELKVTQNGVVVLERGDQTQNIALGVERTTALRTLKNLDSEVQEALLKLLRPARLAYFTVGHGERNEATAAETKAGRSAKELKQELSALHFRTKDLGIGQGLGEKVPDDADLVIVLAPKTAFSEGEIAALRSYVDGGGKLLIALDPSADADFRNLAYLADVEYTPTPLADDKVTVSKAFNITDRRNIVVNSDPRVGGGFSSHASVASLSKKGPRAGLIFEGTGSLEKRPDADAEIAFIARSSQHAFVDQNGNFQADGGEARASYNLAVAASKAAPDGAAVRPGAPAESRVIVTASAEPLNDFWLSKFPDHREFARGVVQWLSGEEAYAGTVVTTEDVLIEHTEAEDKVWFYGVIFGAPGLVLGLGLALVRRSRRARTARPRRREPASDDSDGDSDSDSDSDSDDDSDDNDSDDNDSDELDDELDDGPESDANGPESSKGDRDG